VPGEKLATVPAPVRATVCGLPVALSVREIVPVTMPFATGVKVTEIVQLAPAAMVAVQLLVSAKCKLGLILEILRVAVPVFVRVMF
jgi:hypothetical protein